MSETSTTMSTATAPREAYCGLAGRAVLAVGPLAAVAAVLHFQHSSVLAAMPVGVLLAVTLLFFSPLPISVPALILGDARDWALPRMRGAATPLRALALVPYLLTSKDSPCRTEMALSVAGFAAALAVAVPFLG